MRKNTKVLPEYKKRGVYLIINHGNNKVYVGSTHISFYERWNAHKDHLRHNKHKNPYLQHAWNKWGESMFEFMILETIDDKDKILGAEQFYLDIFFGENCYNMQIIAGSSYGRVTKTRTRNIYFIDPDGNKHGPIHNMSSFAREHIENKFTAAVGLRRLSVGQINSYKGWKRGFDLPQHILDDVKEQNREVSRKKSDRLRKQGLLKAVGRPKISREDEDRVIQYKLRHPNASLRQIDKATGIKYISVRRILKDTSLDYSRFTMDDIDLILSLKELFPHKSLNWMSVVLSKAIGRIITTDNIEKTILNYSKYIDNSIIPLVNRNTVIDLRWLLVNQWD